MTRRRPYLCGEALKHAEAWARRSGVEISPVEDEAITANGSETALTTATLAARLNRSTEWTAELLAESQADGIVVEAGTGGWRLSAAGERRFGQAFRSLSLPRDGLEVPAGGNTG